MRSVLLGLRGNHLGHVLREGTSCTADYLAKGCVTILLVQLADDEIRPLLKVGPIPKGGARAPAAAADRKQRPDATCEGKNG